jgi:hypothetical protein
MPYVGVKPASITSATEAEIAGDLTVDTSTLKVDSANNNVGIGNTIPNSFTQNASQRLVVGSGSGSQGLTIYAGNASYSSVSFADGTSGAQQYAGFLNYNHNGDVLQVGIGGSERARFTANGLTFNGDTAASNALSDYEEGLHVTTATPNTSGSITLSSGADTFAYTKIGRLVHISGELAISSVSSPVGAVVDFTVPFACSSLSETSERSGGGVFWTDGGTGYFVLPAFTFSGAIIRIFKDASVFAANDAISFGFSYITDS